MRNRCEKVNELFDAYVDKELSGRKIKYVEEHVATCSFCDRELKSLQKVKSLVKSNLEEVPQEVWTNYWLRIESKLKEPLSREQSYRSSLFDFIPSRRRLIWGVAVAALVFLLLVLPNLYLFERGKEQTLKGSVSNACEVHSIEYSNPEARVMIFKTEEADMTIVWLFSP